MRYSRALLLLLRYRHRHSHQRCTMLDCVHDIQLVTLLLPFAAFVVTSMSLYANGQG